MAFKILRLYINTHVGVEILPEVEDTVDSISLVDKTPKRLFCYDLDMPHLKF